MKHCLAENQNRGVRKSALVLLSIGLFSGAAAHAQTPTPVPTPEAWIQGYGFVLANTYYASQSVASFDSTNLSAPTAAAKLVATQDYLARSSFQLAQSRLGFWVLPSQPSRAQFEFDFIDFNRASPTTQMLPRVRIAKIEYQIDETDKIIFGQDWDVFSPTTPITYNPVGNYFRGGNSAFMRIQFAYFKTLPGWELAAGLGMAGTNGAVSSAGVPAATDGPLEWSGLPSLSLRISRVVPEGRFGVSAIVSRVMYNADLSSINTAYGYGAFAELKYRRFAVKTEAYFGQNLAKLGALTLANGTATYALREFGSFVTGRWNFTERTSVFGGGGLAQIQDPPADGGGIGGVVGVGGLKVNLQARLGLDHRLTDKLVLFGEWTQFNSQYLDGSISNATVADVGMQLTF